MEVLEPDPELEAVARDSELEPVSGTVPPGMMPGTGMPAGPVGVFTGVVGNSVPSELSFWVGNVQRKVEKVFQVPAGIRMDAAENVAEVTFRVDRNGNLIGEPTVTKPAADPALGQAGVQAILLAAPFPNLPEDFPRDEQIVVRFLRRKILRNGRNRYVTPVDRITPGSGENGLKLLA